MRYPAYDATAFGTTSVTTRRLTATDQTVSTALQCSVPGADALYSPPAYRYYQDGWGGLTDGLAETRPGTILGRGRSPGITGAGSLECRSGFRPPLNATGRRSLSLAADEEGPEIDKGCADVAFDPIRGCCLPGSWTFPWAFRTSSVGDGGYSWLWLGQACLGCSNLTLRQGWGTSKRHIAGPEGTGTLACFGLTQFD